MTAWRHIAYLTGTEAGAVQRGGPAALAALVRARLEGRAAAWSRLPMVVRVRAGGDSKTARRAHPWRTLDLAPPSPDLKRLSANGSHLLLDATLQRVVVVLYGWDLLELDADALADVGLPGDALMACLQRASRSPAAEAGDAARWEVRREGGTWQVHTGRLDGSVSPVVGRLLVGEISVECERYAVEVLALPRLSARRVREGHSVDLGAGGDELSPAARDFLSGTVWATGSPQTLLGLLRLAHRDTPLRIGLESVRLSTDQDPSPLAWLALLSALEGAAEHQRRQYVRQDEVRAAPVGSVRMGAWINNMARQRPDRVPVTRFLLSADCLENRLFRGVARYMADSVRQAGELGRWMSRSFDDVEVAFEKADLVEPQLWMCETLLQQSLPAPVEAAVRQCQAALGGRYPGLALRPGALLTTRTFELDLALLFEAAMRELVRQVVVDSGLDVVDGNVEPPRHGVEWLMAGGGPNTLKPDLVLRHRGRAANSAVLAVGDAKYKRRWDRSSYKPLQRSDFHQLMTYMLAWPDARWGLVLMPWEGGESGGPATHQLQELALPDGRRLGVFQVAADRWKADGREPLVRWLRQRQEGTRARAS